MTIATRGKERDEDKVTHWKLLRWLESKNVLQQHAWIFFQDESG